MFARSLALIAFALAAATPATAAEKIEAGSWTVWKAPSFVAGKSLCQATAQDTPQTLTVYNESSFEWAIFTQDSARNLQVLVDGQVQERHGASSYELAQGVRIVHVSMNSQNVEAQIGTQPRYSLDNAQVALRVLKSPWCQS